MKNFFKITSLSKDGSKARRGIISTPHGIISTPAFIPVATQGTVKTLTNDEIESAGVDVLIANAYHLYLRPGPDIIISAGGLHRFTNWNKTFITDSGGFQLYSLSSLVKVNENGVEFRSHIDGSLHFFTPESVVKFQSDILSDIIMCLDECLPYPSDFSRVKDSVELTTFWAKRCKAEFNKLKSEGRNHLIFGIIQGGSYSELRKKSAYEITGIGFDGYAIGGLSVGEPKEVMYEIISETVKLLPEDLPRYAMGVGTPEDVLFAIKEGIDLFDCVLPTRNGRNGQAFTKNGKLNIKNSKFSSDFNPIEDDCPCLACKRYTRAFIHHLFHAGEILGMKLLSLHNINFMTRLIRNSL